MSPRKTQDSSQAFKKKGSPLSSLAGKLPLVIILIIVVIAFVLVPLMSGIAPSASGDLVFGSYGSDDIEYRSGSYFYNQVNMLNDMYRDQISQSEDLFDFYRYYIWSSAYQESVIFTAKKHALMDSGFSFSDRGISRQIVNSGYYNNDQGEFDESLYASVTAAQRDEIKKTLLDSAYLDRFNADRLGGIYKSEAQVEFMKAMSPVEKQFRYVTFSASQYPNEEVLTYGRSHSDLFTSYPLSRITAPTKAEAQDIIKALDEGEVFADAATASSTDMYAAAGGVIGDVYRFALTEELGEEKSNAVLGLTEGNYTAEPLETDYGWYIYRMDGAAKTPDFSDDALVSTVRSWMSWNESVMIDSWVMEQADAFVASLNNEDSFVLEAVKEGFEVKNTEYFPLNWGSSPLVGIGLNSATDSVIQGAAQSDDFFTQAFALENEGDVSEPVILDNAVVVLQLMGSRDSDSAPTDYTVHVQLQQMQDGLYSSLATDSEIYEDNFMNAYYQVFPPEGTEES